MLKCQEYMATSRSVKELLGRYILLYSFSDHQRMKPLAQVSSLSSMKAISPFIKPCGNSSN